MDRKTEYPTRLTAAAILFAGALLSLYVAFISDVTILPLQPGDAFLVSLPVLQFLWSLALLVGSNRSFSWARFTALAQGLFLFTLVLYLFAYIYASNANMDYIQRFAATSGHIDFAPDTHQERWIATRRFLPSLLTFLVLYCRGVAGQWRNARKNLDTAIVPVLASVVLSVLAFPSFVSTEGFGLLGWVMVVPLFVVLRRDRGLKVVWYGVVYGVFFILLGNYWLGTFSLISLQMVCVIFFVYFLLFSLVVAVVYRYVGRGQWLVLPVLWTLFEYLRSSGFMGYPWLLAAHSQYRFVPVLQFAAVGGVWLVSFLVLLVNALLAEVVVAWLDGPGTARRAAGEMGAAAGGAAAGRPRSERIHAEDVRLAGPSLDTPRFCLCAPPLPARRWLAGAGALLSAIWLLGALLTLVPMENGGSVRVALIQQNSDPRKHDYEATFTTLIELTDRALESDPDIIAWSETAFVPNIRRWSQEDPRRHYLAALARDFLAYQRSTGTWLLTGNDDYQRVLDDAGDEVERFEYNAAVLFDAEGGRRETYYKIKLVPFTEYFPYRDILPGVYEMLLNFDVQFWEPGEERTVFEHPSFRFATPICFEDVFPGETREFALAGAQVILNISNDYWSLTEVAAMQHFSAGLFRAPELRRPVLRSTASGVTGYVDPHGRILDTRPQYSQEYLVCDVALDSRTSLYLRWGDWVPAVLVLVFVVVVAMGRGHGIGQISYRRGERKARGR